MYSTPDHRVSSRSAALMQVAPGIAPARYYACSPKPQPAGLPAASYDHLRVKGPAFGRENFPQVHTKLRKPTRQGKPSVRTPPAQRSDFESLRTPRTP